MKGAIVQVTKLVAIAFVLLSALTEPVAADHHALVTDGTPLTAGYSWSEFCSQHLHVEQAHSILRREARKHGTTIRDLEPRIDDPVVQVACNSKTTSSEALVVLTVGLERWSGYEVSERAFASNLYSGISASLLHFNPSEDVTEGIAQGVSRSAESFFSHHAKVNRNKPPQATPLASDGSDFAAGTGMETDDWKTLTVVLTNCDSPLPNVRGAIRSSAANHGVSVKIFDEAPAHAELIAGISCAQFFHAGQGVYLYQIAIDRSILYVVEEKLYRGSASTGPINVFGSEATGLLDLLLREQTITRHFLEGWNRFLREYVAANR